MGWIPVGLERLSETYAFFFFSSRRRHTRSLRDWSSDVCSSDLLADLAVVLLVRDAAAKQEYLESLSVHERLLKLTRHLSHEIEVLELGSKIQKDVQDEMEKGQREFVLRQQLKAIQKELGGDSDNEAAIEKLQEEIAKAGMPPQAREAAERELNR